MRSKRYLWFSISILIGLAVGTFYGWFIRKPSLTDMPLAALRADFKTDYVLMVAEIFKVEGDVALAQSRLVLVGADSPAFIVQQAFSTARELNYNVQDIESLTSLSRALSNQGGSKQP